MPFLEISSQLILTYGTKPAGVGIGNIKYNIKTTYYYDSKKYFVTRELTYTSFGNIIRQIMKII